MKYTIIFCLLFVLINSKQEFRPPKFSLLKGLTINNHDSNSDTESECDAESKSECKNQISPEEDEMCCYLEIKIDGENMGGMCQSVGKNMEDLKEVYKMKEFKYYYREVMGFQIYNEGDYFPGGKTETKYTCKNFDISIDFENKYTDKEKNTLKSEKHCLYINSQKEKDIDFDVGECKDYLVLDSSKSNGIECGYFVYNITLESKKNVISKNCNLFNLKFISKMAKMNENDMMDEEGAKEIINEMGIYENVESFTVEAYNAKGQKVKYDSKTKKVIVEGSGFMLTASKYLFLLFLILF